MSDTSQGPGWWYASDGKWYPPELAAPVEPPVETAPIDDAPPAWSALDQTAVAPVPASYDPTYPPAQPTYPPAQPTYGTPPASYDAPPGSPSYPSYGTPPWTPGAPPGSPASPGWPDAGGPSPKPSSKVPLLVAGAVVLVLLAIGGIVVATRSDDHQAATATDSSSTTSTTASGASSTSPTATSAPTDFTTFHDTSERFSIATPASWKQVSLSDPKAQSVIDKMMADNPKLAATLGRSSNLSQSAIKFFAASPDSSATVNVSVGSVPGVPAHPTDEDLSTLAPTISQTIERAGGSVTSHEITTVNGQKALELHYDLTFTFGSTEVTMHGTQYIFFSEDTIYAVVLVGDSDVVAEVISTFTIG